MQNPAPSRLLQMIRDLWREAFHDSEEFMDIYFSMKYTPEVNMAVFDGDRLAAAAQLLPYPFRFLGHSIAMGYVSGLATAELYRRRGYASQILSEVHQRLFREGAVFSFLIPGSPALREFYRKSEHGGYATVAHRVEQTFYIPQYAEADIEVTWEDNVGSELYAFYCQQAARMPLMVENSVHDLQAAWRTCLLAEGGMLVARVSQKVVGFCLVVLEDDGRCCLRSLWTKDDRVRAALFHALRQRYAVETVFMRVPTAGVGVPYAMARVVNVQKLLSIVAQRTPELHLHVGIRGDLDLPTNNGYFLVEGGRVTSTDLCPQIFFTPGELAAHFLSSHPLCMEMMLDE